ncbi:MAG: aldehyde ferredoxin oxidoreductase family protein [Candidatus Freyarchaeota archaeon]
MAWCRGGYVGRIGRVDLSKGKVKIEDVKPNLAVKFIGGRGWCAKLVWDEIPASADPLGPENKLIIATGPLTGLLIPGAGKTSFGAISPATGYYGDSNVGGMWGTELKQAGFDALVLEGQSSKPVYLWVENGEIELRDADGYWGMGSLDVEIALKRDLGDELIRVASIGPAGENLVKFSCITCDYGRQAGRTGMGAVMGSKRVKAVVVRGSRDIPVADVESMRRLFEESMEHILRHKALKIWQRQGTMMYIDWTQENVCLPTRNFSSATYEKYRQINGDVMEETSKVADRACFACPICCGNFSIIKRGPYKGVGVEGPEYETAAMIGSNCALPALEDILYANYLCDNLGFDSISAGNVAAFAMECYERGIITKEELDGIELKFGNAPALFQFLELMAKRKGMGNLFAEGVKKASEVLGKGSEEFAMHVKGLEISGYDVRAAQAMGLAYATADIGAHHNRAWAIAYDIEVGREKYGEDKVKLVIRLQHARPLFDCLGTCRFQWLETELDIEFYAKFYTAATGIKVTIDELLLASERVYNLTRAIGIRRGLKPEREEWLPERVFKDPVPKGTVRGSTLDKKKFREMIQTYYKLRGWNERGIPTREKLVELGLEDVARALHGSETCREG